MSVPDPMFSEGRQLQISVDLAGDRAVISLAGELDISVEQEIIDAVNAATSTPGLARLTLDVAALTLFGSSGVRCLLLARESAIGHGVQFNVASTSAKPVRRTLDICELTAPSWPAHPGNTAGAKEAGPITKKIRLQQNRGATLAVILLRASVHGGYA